MTGRTHYQFGIVTGMTAVLILGLNPQNVAGAELITLISVAGSGVGSILPDCDIRTSKAGKIYKKISNVILLVGCFCLGISVMSAFYDSEFIRGMSAVFTVLGTGCVLFYAGMRSVKHRGFTHGIIIPLLLCALYFFLIHMQYRMSRELSIIALSFLFGVILGYVSHLFADMFNPKGVPVFYPAGFKLSLMKIPTRSKAECVWFWITSAVFLVIGFFCAL